MVNEVRYDDLGKCNDLCKVWLLWCVPAQMARES